MEERSNKFNGIKQLFKVNLSSEVILVSLIIILPSIELFSFLFRGLIPSFFLFSLWFLVYFLKGYSRRIKVLKEYMPVFILLGLIYLLLFFHYGLSLSSKSGLLQFLNLLHLGCVFFICAYYSSNVKNDISLRITVFLLVLTVLLVFSLISIPYIFSNDILIIRNLSSGQLNEFQEYTARKNGVGTNGLYSSLSVVVIYSLALISSFRFKGILKKIIILSIIPLSLSIFISTFFASVSLFIFGLILYLISQKNGNILFFSIKVIFLLVGLFFIIYFFLMDLELFKPILNKVERFIDVGGDDTGRTTLAANSFNTFLDNPLWGIGVTEKGSFHLIGEHMPWVDFLGQYGIIITIFIYLVFLVLFQKIFFSLKILNVSSLNSASRVVFILFILGNFISPLIFYPLSYCLLFLCGLPILDKSKL